MGTIVHLSLGSNVGDRAHSLQDAIARLNDYGTVRTVSHFYETEPVDVPGDLVGDLAGQDWFLNCALALETAESPTQLISNLLGIERSMGRVRTQAKGPRIIDIDILLFADLVLNTPELTIPHAEMHKRRFVLEPLAEIAAEARHPLLDKTVRELLEELPAGQIVIRKN
jgi:2-amino-4-hydroxy-6-hydroxymethyldihydropteridine diphosphokinase